MAGKVWVSTGHSVQGAGRRKWKDGCSVHVHIGGMGMARYGVHWCRACVRRNPIPMRLSTGVMANSWGRGQERKDDLQCNANICEVYLMKEKGQGTGHRSGCDIERQP